MVEVNKRYFRIAPNKDKTTVFVRNEQEKAYYEGLESDGFVYMECP